MFNYSFWADEAGISNIAKQLVLSKTLTINLLNLPGIAYQKLYVLTVALFFKFFGISEFSARLPSMIAFGIGMIIIFFLAKKMSNIYGAVISAFLYSLSHLNLSYATQAKPYTMIETLMLLGLLTMYLIKNEKKPYFLFFYHLVLISIFSVATFFHQIGIFLWIIYCVFILFELSKLSKTLQILLNRKKIFYLLLIPFVLIIFFPLKEFMGILFPMLAQGNIFKYNNLYQVIKLFAYKYSIISLSSLFGFICVYKREKQINLGILLYGIILLVFVVFVSYTFNIRYVLTLFGIIFLYFGIFWAKVGGYYLPKKPWAIPLAVVIILYVTGYKIVRWPQSYYNPNIDKYGDVQIANYKDFYLKLKERFPNYKKLYVINDTFDAENWYFGRYSNAYFMKFTLKPHKQGIVNVTIYGTLADFKTLIKAHPQGLLIMEDWQSFLPDDVKEYAKNNLKLEFRVESLKEAPDDRWPLALYSWGSP